MFEWKGRSFPKESNQFCTQLWLAMHHLRLAVGSQATNRECTPAVFSIMPKIACLFYGYPRRAVKLIIAHSRLTVTTLWSIISLCFPWCRILTLWPLDYVWDPYLYPLALKYVTFSEPMFQLSKSLRVARSNVWEKKPSQEDGECRTFGCPWPS